MPKARIMVAGVALASFLALTVSGSLYLSMLSHGRSLTRIYIGEWVRWIFWALAGPLVVRAGMRLMRPDGVDRRARKRAVGLGLVLLPLHFMLGVPFAVWLQPLWPMEIDTDWLVISSSQLPTYLATDLLLFVLLLMAGNAYSVYQRARRVELREARLETDLAHAQLDALRLEIQAEHAFGIPAEGLQRCLSGPFSVPRLRACLDDRAVGAVRASIGIPTTGDDLDRLEELIAELTCNEAKPARTPPTSSACRQRHHRH